MEPKPSKPRWRGLHWSLSTQLLVVALVAVLLGAFALCWHRWRHPAFKYQRDAVLVAECENIDVFRLQPPYFDDDGRTLAHDNMSVAEGPLRASDEAASEIRRVLLNPDSYYVPPRGLAFSIVVGWRDIRFRFSHGDETVDVDWHVSSQFFDIFRNGSHVGSGKLNPSANDQLKGRITELFGEKVMLKFRYE